MAQRKTKSTFARNVYIVDGARTPFLKARGKTGPFSGSDLAVYTGRTLLARQPFAPTDLDEVVIGCMLPSPNEANIGRVIAMRLGCGKRVPGWTVQRNCASGLQAIDSAAQLIAAGRAELMLAGGTDAMSHAPLLFNKQMVNWLADWQAAKTFPARLQLLLKLRPQFFAPVIALIGGLTDHIVGYNMGQTAEIVADRFKITRAQMDEFAVRSHQRLAIAQDQHYLDEITPVYDTNGKVYLEDDGIRRDTTVEKLAKLKPNFDKMFGLVTAGNSSQVTDGAALLLLASADAVKKYQLPILGRIIDMQWAGLEPSQMGLGPVHAITPLLQRQHLALNDIDCYEINEAFAAQVLGCLAAWQDETYCREELGLPATFGMLDMNKLNIDGGAIAIGHPIGASGARITLRLLKILRRQQKRLGIASLCVGGGLGGAVLVENTSEVSA